MTEDELKAIVERINSYWTTPHPKEDDGKEKVTLGVIHDFDRIPDDFMPDATPKDRHTQWFQTPEHVRAVKDYYERRADDICKDMISGNN